MNRRFLIVGNPIFLARHRPLAGALHKRLGTVDEIPVFESASAHKAAYILRGFAVKPRWPPRAALRDIAQRYLKEPATFDRLSARAARRIAQYTGERAFALQLFSLSSPAAGERHVPYAHYLDMTMALVRRAWPAWAPFTSEAKYKAWIAREGASYRAAERVFTFSESTRRSVIEDYGVRPERVVAVGAAGHYEAAAPGEREYGNRTLIFNGSAFERKGGDLALAAFRIVREQYPDTTLTVVANPTVAPEPGLRVLGHVDRATLFALFDTTDVVLAPTRLDVLPGFVLEAMSRGVVPVLSDAPSMSEMIRDGSEGFVVSPPTPALLAERTRRLFADRAQLRDFGVAARARVVREWNWDAVAQRMLDSLAESGLP